MTPLRYERSIRDYELFRDGGVFESFPPAHGSAFNVVGIACCPQIARLVKRQAPAVEYVFGETPILIDPRMKAEISEVYYDREEWNVRCEEQRAFDEAGIESKLSLSGTATAAEPAETNMTPFTKQQIANWRELEAIRKGGALNMFNAQSLVKMSERDYAFTVRNWMELTEAIKPRIIDGETVQYIGSEEGLNYFNLGENTFATKTLEDAEITQAATACKLRCAQ